MKENQDGSEPSEKTDPVIAVSSSAWLALAIICGLALVTMYGETMVLPAIPDFIKDFSISYNTSSWILSSYLIAGAVMTPIAGKLSDIYGRKKILLIVMMIYSAGILAGGFASSLPFLLAARIAQGVGISMFPIAFGIVRDIFPIQKLGMAQGIFTSTFFGGSVIGLIAGAKIISDYGWHATFFSVFPVAIVLAFIMNRFIKIKKTEQDTGTMGIDVKGTLALSSTVILFLMGLSFLQEISSGNLDSLGFFAGSAISLIIFVGIEKRAAYPLIDLKVLSDKVLLPSNIIMIIVGVSTFMVYQTIPILIRSPKPLGFGGDVITIATVQLPFMIVSLIVSAAGGFFLSRLGNFKLTALGTIICTVGFFSILTFHFTESTISATLAIISVGLSFAIIGCFNIILMSSPQKVQGISLGMSVLLMLVGNSLGPSLAGMYQQMYRETIPHLSGSFPSAQAYDQIFLTAALLSVVSVFLVIVLRKRIGAKTNTIPI
jgi:MFS family permease